MLQMYSDQWRICKWLNQSIYSSYFKCFISFFFSQRFNNSVLCRICNKRIFYPDKRIQEDDDFEESDEDDFRLRCEDCKKVHDNVHMKKFFALLAQQSETNFTMNHLYTTYLSAIFGMGSLDEIRYHMTEMMLHTLITNRSNFFAFSLLFFTGWLLKLFRCRCHKHAKRQHTANTKHWALKC